MRRQDYIGLSHQQIFDVSAAAEFTKENLIVIGIYHSNLTCIFEYLTFFEKLLIKINDDGFDAVIMGDTNIDLLVKSSYKKLLYGILTVHNFVPFIDFPTREPGSSGTFLDHAYSNIQSSCVSASSITTHFSDHMVQRLCVTRSTRADDDSTIKRVYSMANKIHFCCALESVD